MKIDRKTVIISTLIGLLIGSGVVIADTIFNYSMRGSIYIPMGTQIELSGLPKDVFGEYYFETIELVDAKGMLSFQLNNMGSNSVTISYTLDEPTNISLVLEGYESGSTDGDKFKDTPSTTLDRGKMLDCRLLIEDLGATPNTAHDFTLYIMVVG